MFVTALKNEFGYDTPIFTKEILQLFPQFTAAYVFRLIKVAQQNGDLSRINSGVYYIPQTTLFGSTCITATDIARKRYIESGGKIYGIYSGLMLQNAFSITTQIPNTLEIVTNRESTRRRKVTIDGMVFILRKSRIQINNENADAYRVLQLFTDKNFLEFNDSVEQFISDFIQEKNISRNSLLELAKVFPAKTLKNMIYSGVI